MMRAPALLALLALAACQAPAEDRARQDAETVVAVEKIQQVEPPLLTLVPEPLGVRDLKVTGLTGPGCAFTSSGATEPIVRTNDKAAIVKLMGGIVAFASDPGGAKLPAGTWAHYVGKAHSVLLEPGAEGAPAVFTLRDPQDRAVFRAEGTLDCEG